jgi:hypothetical protein
MLYIIHKCTPMSSTHDRAKKEEYSHVPTYPHNVKLYLTGNYGEDPNLCSYEITITDNGRPLQHSYRIHRSATKVIGFTQERSSEDLPELRSGSINIR